MRTKLLLIALLSLLGCGGTVPADSTNEHALVNRGRTEMWAQNCQTCHNARSSRYYSDTSWDIAMHHMRVRGALTAHETRTILEHLQAAN